MGSVLGLPFFLASTLITNNFWLSIAATGIRYFVAENFWSPNVTMISKSCPAEKYGNMYSAYQFYTIMAGCVSTMAFGGIVNWLNCANNPVALGRILAAFCGIGYVGSTIAWHYAGKAFEKLQNKGKGGEIAPMTV